MAGAARRAGGFTLLEMLIVLTLAAGLATLVTVDVIGRIGSVEAAALPRKTAALLRQTRLVAIRSREEQVLTVDLDGRTLTAPGRPALAIPEGVEVELYTASREILSRQQGAIRFFPDGGSTGGQLTYGYGGRAWRVRVGWLTGDIDVLEGRGDTPPGR